MTKHNDVDLGLGSIIGGRVRLTPELPALIFGDVGTFDDEGYLYVVDRAKDMVITGDQFELRDRFGGEDSHAPAGYSPVASLSASWGLSSS